MKKRGEYLKRIHSLDIQRYIVYVQQSMKICRCTLSRMMEGICRIKCHACVNFTIVAASYSQAPTHLRVVTDAMGWILSTWWVSIILTYQSAQPPQPWSERCINKWYWNIRIMYFSFSRFTLSKTYPLKVSILYYIVVAISHGFVYLWYMKL